jgi:hypothetical protein
MQDLHKPSYLDAKMEVGTEVRFFKFSMNNLLMLTMFIAVLTLLLMFLMPNYWTEVFCSYMGSFVTLVVLYIKYGTN